MDDASYLKDRSYVRSVIELKKVLCVYGIVIMIGSVSSTEFDLCGTVFEHILLFAISLV